MADNIGEAEIIVDADTRPAERKLRKAEGRFRKAGGESGDAFGDEFSDRAEKQIPGRMEALAGKASSSFSRRLTRSFTRTFSQIGRSLGLLVGAQAGLTGLVVGLGNVAGILPGIVSSVGALGVLPGLVGTAGAAVATLAVGVSGLGDAFKNMGDPEKFAEALAKLAPSARTFVKAVKEVGPAWKEMQQSVQQTLFAGAASQFKALSSSYLPLVSQGMNAVADSANHAAKRISQMLQTSQAMDGVSLTFDATSRAVKNIGEGFAEAVPGAAQLMGASSDLFAEMTTGLEEAGTRFSLWADRVVSDGSFEEWTRKGLAAVGDMGSSLWSIGRIFGAIGTAAQAAGGATLSSMADGLDRIATNLESIGAQDAMTKFFAGFAKGWEGIKTAAGPAVTEMLGTVAMELSKTAAAIGPTLGSTIASIAGIFSTLAPIVGSLMRALSPVIASLAGGLKSAIDALAPTLASIVGYFERNTGALKALLAVVAGAVVITKITSVLMSLAAIVGPVVGKFALLRGAFAGLMTLIKGGAAFKVAAVAVKGLGMAFTFLTGPVGLIIAALALVGVALVALYKKNETFRNFVNSAWAGIKAGIQVAVDWFVGTAWPAMVSAFEAIKAGAMALWSGGIVPAFNGIKAAAVAAFGFFQTYILPIVMTVFNTVKSVISGALTVITGIFNVFKGLFTGDWQTLWTGLSQILSGAWQIISSIVMGALTYLQQLFTAGWALIKAIFSAAWTAIKVGVTSSLMAIKTVITVVWAGIKAAFTAAINTIKAVVVLGFTLMKNSSTAIMGVLFHALINVWNAIKSAVTAVVNAIKSVVVTVWNAIRAGVTAAVNAVRSVVVSVWNAIKAATSAAWNGIKAAVSAGINAARSVVTSVINAIKAVVTGAWNAIKSATSSAWNSFKSLISSAINAAKSAVSSGISNVVSTIRGLPGRITSALGNLGSLLTQKGRDLIQGLINGITEKIGALKAKVSEAASAVKNFMPGSPVKEGPLKAWNYGSGVSGAGRALMSGLAEGIEAQVGRIGKASSLAAAAAMPRGTALAPAMVRGQQAPQVHVSAPGAVLTRADRTALEALANRPIRVEYRHREVAAMLRDVDRRTI